MVVGDELDDIASIRERPGMFVGDVRTRSATHQLVWEVLANAVDEHLAGRCTRIELTLHADGSVSVRDDGAGISLDVDESGTPWVERVLTTRHFTATADGHAPHVHLRPSHHVGLCMVSALSSSLSAEVRRDGEAWRIELERGRIRSPLAKIGDADTTGTTLRFTPDAEVFARPDVEVEAMARRVRELAALLPGLVTRFSCEGHEWGRDAGLEQLLESSDHARVHERPVTGEARQGDARARVAFEWRDWPPAPRILGYCNLDPAHAGTHIEGFRRGLAEGLGRRDPGRVFEALSGGLAAVVSVLVIDPEYQGPTRERIGSEAARAVVAEATARALRRALASDPELARRITARLERVPEAKP